MDLSDNLLNRTSTDKANISSSTYVDYTEIESDEIGNIVGSNGAEFRWNGRRLESVSENGKDIVTYKYNADGQRISKTVDGVTTDTTLTEVKNVKYISNTQQLRDFATYANMQRTPLKLELWVRPTTRVAQTVIDAGWHINYLW